MKTVTITAQHIAKAKAMHDDGKGHCSISQSCPVFQALIDAGAQPFAVHCYTWVDHKLKEHALPDRVARWIYLADLSNWTLAPGLTFEIEVK